MFWVTFFCALPKTLYFSGREPMIGNKKSCPYILDNFFE